MTASFRSPTCMMACLCLQVMAVLSLDQGRLEEKKRGDACGGCASSATSHIGRRPAASLMFAAVKHGLVESTCVAARGNQDN